MRYEHGIKLASWLDFGLQDGGLENLFKILDSDMRAGIQSYRVSFRDVDPCRVLRKRHAMYSTGGIKRE